MKMSITVSFLVLPQWYNVLPQIKQEASGWPAGLDTEEQRQAYIENYYKHEGIRLDYANIQKNPGLRTLAKMFCQNTKRCSAK